MPVKTGAPRTRFACARGRAVLAALLLALAAGWSSGAALAHAIVVQSVLDGGVVPAAQAQDFEIRFNVAIEADFLKVTVENPGGPVEAVETRLTERSDVMVVHLPVLAPGSYVLRYKVLAADGHLSQGTLRFTASVEP